MFVQLYKHQCGSMFLDSSIMAVHYTTQASAPRRPKDGGNEELVGWLEARDVPKMLRRIPSHSPSPTE